MIYPRDCHLGHGTAGTEDVWGKATTARRKKVLEGAAYKARKHPFSVVEGVCGKAGIKITGQEAMTPMGIKTNWA